MGEAGPTDAFTLAARRVPLSVAAGGLSVARRSSLTPRRRRRHRGSGWPGCKTLPRLVHFKSRFPRETEKETRNNEVGRQASHRPGTDSWPWRGPKWRD